MWRTEIGWVNGKTVETSSTDHLTFPFGSRAVPCAGGVPIPAVQALILRGLGLQVPVSS